MESVMKLLQRNGSERTAGKEEKVSVNQRNILEEIREVSRQLAYNDCWFQLECDGNLIDACIYQREELRARYRYLLDLAKRNEVNCASFQK